MTDCHKNTATAPLSVCHKAPVKILTIQADLSWSPLPLVPFCTAAIPFFFSIYYILLSFCPFCLDRHLLLLGPETHSLRACLSQCPSSNRVLSLSIALDIRLFLLILRPLSSKLFFSRLPHGNLGEHTSLTARLMLLCRHHAFQRTDCPLPPILSIFSPALAFACLLRFEKISFPSTSNRRCSSSFFLDLHQTTQSFDLSIFFDYCSCSDSDELSRTTTVSRASSPQNFRSPGVVQPTEKTEGLTLLPCLLVSWLC